MRQYVQEIAQGNGLHQAEERMFGPEAAEW